MRKITRHRWVALPTHFKTWRCEKCGAVRYWDNILQRICFVKHGKQTYSTPDCNSIINGDLRYDTDRNYERRNQGADKS